MKQWTVQEGCTAGQYRMHIFTTKCERSCHICISILYTEMLIIKWWCSLSPRRLQVPREQLQKLGAVAGTASVARCQYEHISVLAWLQKPVLLQYTQSSTSHQRGRGGHTGRRGTLQQSIPLLQAILVCDTWL
jgi:hypothetical protein